MVVVIEIYASQNHLGEVGANLFGAAAGEQGDPCFAGVECTLCGKFLARCAWEWQIGEGVADEFGTDAVVAIELLLEGEDDEHAVDVFLDELDAVLLPGPELGADEEDDGDAEAVELFGQLEVDVGEVDEDGDRGAALADGLLEAAELAVDAGQVADDLGDAHDGHIFSCGRCARGRHRPCAGRPCRSSERRALAP